MPMLELAGKKKVVNHHNEVPVHITRLKGDCHAVRRSDIEGV